MNQKIKLFFLFLCLSSVCFISGCVNNQFSNLNQSRDIGDNFYNQGKYLEALNHYEKSLEFNPNDSYVQHQKTLSLLELNRIPESIQSIDRELELNQGDKNRTLILLIVKMTAFNKLNQTEEAKKTLQNYLQIDPNDELGFLEKMGIIYTTIIPTQTSAPQPTIATPSPTIQSSSCIELMDLITKEEMYRKGSVGYLKLHGMITNKCYRELNAVRVCATLYDANDMVVGTSGETVFSIQPDTTEAFDIYFSYGEGTKQVSRYQIETRDLELSSNYKC